MILMLMALQAAAAPSPAPSLDLPVTQDQRGTHCAGLVETDPAAAEREAERWRLAGGGSLARQCLGLALAAQDRFADAADAFEAAAHDAETARSNTAASYWAQGGNARLAAGAFAKARADLDAALASGTLTGPAQGEARLDRARAMVAAGDLDGARADIDLALASVPEDPLAWLLSATLARRMRETPRATTDIREALKRSPDDASVQLEAGNIAATRRDEAGARRAWGEAARLAPDTPVGRAARAALAQFEAAGAKPSATTEPR